MDKRSHWSSRLLKTQENIDSFIEKSQKGQTHLKTKDELQLINKVIEEKLGAREEELKEKARQETLFLMEHWHLIKRRFVNPINDFLQRRITQKFKNSSNATATASFQTLELTDQVEGPLLISETYENHFSGPSSLMREFSYKYKFHKFCLSMGILEENNFCHEQDIQDIIYEVGQDFHQFINKDLIFGHVLSHFPKDLFNLSLSDNYFTPLLNASFSVEIKGLKNIFFLILPYELAKHYLLEYEDIL